MYNFSSSLHKFLKKINVKDINNEKFVVVDIWADIAGSVFAKQSEAIYFKEKVLTVKVDTHAYLNELKFFKKEIIDKYNEKFEREVVKDIIFRIADSIPKKDAKKEVELTLNTLVKPEKETKYYLNKKITEYEKDKIDESLKPVKNENLKHSMEAFLEKTRERELSLISQGWRKCPFCYSLHNEKGDFCKPCKSVGRGKKT